MSTMLWADDRGMVIRNDCDFASEYLFNFQQIFYPHIEPGLAYLIKVVPSFIIEKKVRTGSPIQCVITPEPCDFECVEELVEGKQVLWIVFWRNLDLFTLVRNDSSTLVKPFSIFGTRLHVTMCIYLLHDYRCKWIGECKLVH